MESIVVEIKSKLFKGSYKNTWFKASVKLDQQNKKLDVKKYIAYISDEVDEYSTEIELADFKSQEVDPSEIDLLPFRHITKGVKNKIKVINNIPFFYFELSTGRITGKQLKFACLLEDSYNYLHTELTKITEQNNWRDKKGRMSTISMGSLGNLDEEESLPDTPIPRATLSQTSRIDENEETLVTIDCDVYEAIREELLFKVKYCHSELQLNEQEVAAKTKSIFLNHDTNYYLYYDSRKLEILDFASKTLICSLKFNNMRRFTYGSEHIILSMGERCRVRNTQLKFTFENCKECSNFVKLLSIRCCHSSQMVLECMCGCKTPAVVACRHGNDIYDLPTSTKTRTSRITTCCEDEDQAVNQVYMQQEAEEYDSCQTDKTTAGSSDEAIEDVYYASIKRGNSHDALVEDRSQVQTASPSRGPRQKQMALDQKTRTQSAFLYSRSFDELSLDDLVKRSKNMAYAFEENTML